MEFLEGPSSHTTQNATRKKRSQIPRRPRNVSLEFQIYDPSTDDVSQVHTNYRTKEFNLSHFSLFGSQDTSSSHSTVIGDENKVKRVKLKVGSVTHTIETKYNSVGVLSGGSSKTISRNTESAQSRHKLILQDKSDDNFLPPDKKTGLRRISFKNSSYRGREDSSKKLSNKHDPNGEFDEADEDDEIRYLKKLKLSKFAAGSEHSDEESSKKIKRISRCSNNAKLDDFSEDLVSSRSSRYSANEIEFPNGLPLAPKKQKEKLSETDQQLKKAEAAQRRRMQAEKAARESEAEAIRKILGQDSNRKKKEDKVKKRVDDMAQEKAANALTLASKTVRWVMGPAGTVVSFSDDLGLPSIFNFSPCNYPDPREICAGPSCSNPYKYRDSKSKLPLCSLNCYKAVREKVQNQAIV